MRLRRLRLQNFRQHADTEIDFGDGITGIIGANGSGKTTLLEAIAWAIYGTQAVRGDKEGVRNLRAKPRASVKVELDFELGKHTYHVERGLHTAALLRDGQPIANALKEVTDQLEGVLGMRHDEFFNTYFTGQKELAVMAQLGKTERAAFLSRVLGYDRLRIAQERVRETKNALSAELKGLETGLPDRAGLEAERRAAEEKLARARRGTADAERARQSAAQRFAAEEPRWTDWVAKRERTLALDGDRRMAEQAVDAARREFERLDKELAEALAAREQLKKLASELEPIALLKREQAELERLLQEETARRADQAQLEELTRVRGTLAARLTELEGAPAALAETEGEQARAAERVAQAERAAEELRTAWVRDRQDVETKLQAHRDEYRDLKQQRDVIAGLGPAGICPTCKRPLGEEYEEVIAVLDRQLEQIAFNGNFFRQRFDQLAAEPEALLAAERERDAAAAVARAVSERAGTLRAQVQEAERARVERADGERRAAELERQIAARPAGYDAARHDLVRARLTRLDPIALEAAALETRASRAEPLVTEAEIAERSLSQREAQAKALAAAVADQGFSEEEFKAAKDRHDKASLDLRAAELAVAETRGDLTAAEGTVREVERREEERAGRERQIAELKARVRLHGELDRAFADLRTDLNATMRPEIAELASGFLSDLTDGRYDAVDLDEDYQLTVIDDGLLKPVISGGEEDLANLVLRLAISQMIAERAGQPLSLLVLDEVFGSLDEARRQHVLGLLRRLGDRFPQVILITHIEQVREGLDRVIRVEFDPGAGASVLRDDTAILGGADAGVAA